MTKVTKILKNIFAAFVLTVVGLAGIASVGANAQFLPSGEDLCPRDSTGCRLIRPSNNPGRNQIVELATTIANWITFIIASIAIIFVLYGAWLWLTDSDKGPEKGRKIITNAVIALVISVVAYGVVGILLNFLNQRSIQG